MVGIDYSDLNSLILINKLRYDNIGKGIAKGTTSQNKTSLFSHLKSVALKNKIIKVRPKNKKNNSLIYKLQKVLIRNNLNKSTFTIIMPFELITKLIPTLKATPPLLFITPEIYRKIENLVHKPNLFKNNLETQEVEKQTHSLTTVEQEKNKKEASLKVFGVSYNL